MTRSFSFELVSLFSELLDKENRSATLAHMFAMALQSQTTDPRH
jgi:hypothetical protein